MFRPVFLLLSLCALLCALAPIRVAAALTNAERLRRNMPPLPPVRRSGTPVYAAKRGGPSNTPLPSGTIQVRNTNGSTVGYISKNNATSVNFGSADNDLKVQFFKGNLRATNADFYVGGNGTSSIGPGSYDTVAFGAIQKGPTSSIWSLDTATGNLTAQWINADNTKPATTVALDLRNNFLVLTGDLAAYNAHASFPASAVWLFLTA